MTLKPLTYFIAIFFMMAGISTAQTKKASKAAQAKHYPATFTINTTDFEKLFSYKINEVVASKTNAFIDKAVLLMSTKNGDMKFLKLKLAYFKNAFLLVQVNGSYSTQVFVMSDDKSVFYKGHFEKNNVMMLKCSEDEIVSE